MEKKTQFQYLHDSLEQQIVTGSLAYGERLPSLRGLCDLYNVGIRTVLDVVKLLTAEGYLETVQRTCVRVSYRMAGGEAQMAGVVLARRDFLYALPKVMEYIMPHIYAGAAEFCADEVISACRNDIRGIGSVGAKEQWRMSRTALQRVTNAYGNDLLTDLCIELNLRTQPVVVPGVESPFQELSRNAEAGLSLLIDNIAARDHDSVGVMIRNMYHGAAADIDAYFTALSVAYPAVRPEPIPYRWSAEKGRARTYMQVTRSIVKKIVVGEYPDGTCLPGQGRLCEEYQVSSYTMGEVMRALERIRLVEKQNRHGEYVITCANAQFEEFFKHGTPKADALTFLNAAHIIALMSEGIAALGFDYLTQEGRERLCRCEKNRDRLGMETGILCALVQVQPYQPLKVIWREIANLMEWGFYFSVADAKRHAPLAIYAKRNSALKALEDGDKETFAAALRDTYCSVFKEMQKMLCELGVTEAARVKLGDGVRL